jgi:hypothetical protein
MKMRNKQRGNRAKWPIGGCLFYALVPATVVLAVFPRFCGGQDWPTAGHDAARSCVSSQQLELPLQPAWVHGSRHAPRPAWPAPAKRDVWHMYKDMPSESAFDRAFQVVAAEGAVFLGSLADGKVHCLDAATGRPRWSFFTEGPVRLAAAIADGRAKDLQSGPGRARMRRHHRVGFLFVRPRRLSSDVSAGKRRGEQYPPDACYSLRLLDEHRSRGRARADSRIGFRLHLRLFDADVDGACARVFAAV